MSAATNQIHPNLNPTNRKEVGTSKGGQAQQRNFLHKLTQHLTVMPYFKQIRKLRNIRHLSSHAIDLTRLSNMRDNFHKHEGSSTK